MQRRAVWYDVTDDVTADQRLRRLKQHWPRDTDRQTDRYRDRERERDMWTMNLIQTLVATELSVSSNNTGWDKKIRLDIKYQLAQLTWFV